MLARSVADGYRYVRTREPAFIAGAAPVTLWALAANQTGAGSPLALSALGVAGPAAVRYYTSSDHARRNREMRRIGKVFCTYPEIRKASAEAPRMKNFVRTPAGKRVDIEVPKQCDALVFEHLRPLLQNDFRAEVRIERIPAPRFGPLAWASERVRPVTMTASRGSARPGKDIAVVAQGGVRMSIIERDTLAAPLSSLWPVLVPGVDGKIPARLWTDPIPVAQDEDGETADLSFAKRPSVSVAGESGSGKSVFTHEVIDAWILDPRSELMLWDGKGMLELNRYTCLTGGRIAGPDLDAAKAQMAELKAELTRREASLYARGLEEAPEDDPDCPPLLAVIEEFTAYKDAGFYADLLYVLVRVRVVNMRILLTVQRPSAKTVPTDIRDNIGMRVCHSQLTSDSSDMALGDGWAKRGWNAQSIPMDDKGTFAGINLLLNDGGNPRRTRSWFVTPQMRTVAVRRALELRGLPTEWADLRGAALARAVGGAASPRPVAAARPVSSAVLVKPAAAPATPQAPARPEQVTSPAGPAPATPTTPPVDPHAARRAHNATEFAGRRRRSRPGATERRLHTVETED